MRNIGAWRLHNQQLLDPKFKKVKDLVSFMGAMQAQDYAMSKWAVGVRLPGTTEKEVEAAIDKGQIVRTHVLRPTWHLVAAEDIYWMLQLSQPNIGVALRSRHKELELSDKIITRTNKLIGKLLDGDRHLTREEIVDGFKKAKIATNDNRASHILLHAELAGIIASGKGSNGKHTYALLAERVKKKKELHHEEALAMLAQRYFTSHGPATLADFTWWSGLKIKDARLALELNSQLLHSEKINNQEYWSGNKIPASKNKPAIHVLPAFDEFLISYKDRSASLLKEHQPKAFSVNGIFWPTIMVNGQVKGLWKRSIKNDTVHLEFNLFRDEKVNAALLKKAAESYGNFLGKPVKF